MRPNSLVLWCRITWGRKAEQLDFTRWLYSSCWTELWPSGGRWFRSNPQSIVFFNNSSQGRTQSRQVTFQTDIILSFVEKVSVPLSYDIKRANMLAFANQPEHIRQCSKDAGVQRHNMTIRGGSRAGGLGGAPQLNWSPRTRNTNPFLTRMHAPARTHTRAQFWSTRMPIPDLHFGQFNKNDSVIQIQSFVMFIGSIQVITIVLLFMYSRKKEASFHLADRWWNILWK